MIVEKVLGKLGEESFAGRKTDILDIEWFNANKRIDRKMTRGGKDIGLRLDHHTSHKGLSQDDILCDDGEIVVAVNIIPCNCILVKVNSNRELARLCYEVGNRHAPFFYGENELEFLTPYDEPMMLMMKELGLHPEKKEERLLNEKKVSLRVSGHAH